jgi:hypothetical protein
MKKSRNGPLLTNLSTYKSSPKWTISHQCIKESLSRSSSGSLGPAAYHPIACIDKTSKYRKLGPACSFGTSKRFDSFGSLHISSQSVPGPGQYSPPSDFSASPFTSFVNISFGVGNRFSNKMNGRPSTAPGPGQYEVRGKSRRGDLVFSTVGSSMHHRHGWYYDEDVKARRDVPAPGTYDPHHPREHSDRKFTFGVGERVNQDRPESRGIPSPGRYSLKSCLSGRSFSFTHSASRNSKPIKELTVGAICAQPTQFG